MNCNDPITRRYLTEVVAIAGAGIVIGGALMIWITAATPDNLFGSADVPSGLEAYTGDALHAEAVPSPVTGLNAWIVRTPGSPESTAQLAVSAPGSDGFVIGELFNATGEPVNDGLIGGDARQRARFVDLAITTKWVPVTQSDLPSSNSVYLFASPVDPQMQSLWPVIREHRHGLPAIRLVPTAYATPDAFEAVLDIFLAPHEIGGSALASRERLIDYLRGARQIPQTLRDNPMPNPAAVDALSSNGNIHHRLRLESQPTVVAPAADGGLLIQSLRAYLKAHAGVSIELTDDTSNASNNHQG